MKSCGRIQPPPDRINKVLLDHSRTHFFTACPGLLLQDSSWVEIVRLTKLLILPITQFLNPDLQSPGYSPILQPPLNTPCTPDTMLGTGDPETNGI